MRRRDRIKEAFKGPFKAHTNKSSVAVAVPAAPPSPSVTVPGSPASLAQSRLQHPTGNLWGQALNKLSAEDKALLPQINPGSNLDILRHLRAIAQQRQEECDEKRWKFELFGQQIILRDVAQKVIVWIDRFKEIGDIAVNFDPVHAALPWAGIRFLLEIMVVESHQMGALLTGVEKMAYLINRCTIYELLYLNKQLPKEVELKPAVTNLEAKLVALYTIMLDFLINASRTFNKRTGERTLNAVFNPGKLTIFLNECQALENDLGHEVQNCESVYVRGVEIKSDEQMEKLRRLLEAPILRVDSGVATICQKLESSERLSILQWISSIQYIENHSFLRQGRTIGTGEWLLKHQRYRTWQNSSASGILWLHGDPGAGKTKLVSTVIDSFQESFKQVGNDEALAYFYCDRNQPDRRDPSLILSSFVRQLATPRDDDSIHRSIVREYTKARQTAFASGKLKMAESQALLAELFEGNPQTILVVDALDECDETTRLDFMNILDKLIYESSTPVKVFVSSRRDRDIKDHFEHVLNMEITATDNKDDIATFVNHRIATSPRYWQDIISQETKGRICGIIEAKSEGMFQWASLQMDVLLKLRRESDILKRLGKLPKTLKLAYDEIYEKIQLQMESAPTIANRAFQWVMCSYVPLSPAELVAAVCQDPDIVETSKVDVNIDFVIEACQNLLTVDHEQEYCRFSHLSVQEYFEDHHWNSSEANALVGKVCLSLLTYNLAPQDWEVRILIESGKDENIIDLFRYACYYWPDHVQQHGEENIDSRLAVLLKQFLGSMNESSLTYQNWHKMISEDVSSRYIFCLSLQHSITVEVPALLEPSSLASWAIAMFGFYKIIMDWWTEGFTDINQRSKNDDTLLCLAAREGHASVVLALLEKGADTQVDALYSATSRGHEVIARLLIERGVDINALNKDNKSALFAASYHDHEDMVRFLLDNGAIVDDEAIIAASRWGGVETVGLLLDGGAKVNDEALQAALHRNGESVMRLLLDRRANDSAEALKLASSSGHEAVVRLLLDRGVNASAEALEWASRNGHEAVMRLLLDRGANASAEALEMASLFDHEAVVRLLLDRGANASAEALKWASRYGYEAVVRLLLDRGVNASAEALKWASSSGHEAVVRLLLDRGANASAEALEMASLLGHEAVVRLLLDRGANASAEALQPASRYGYEAVVRLLLDRGANASASALKWASESGHEAVVRLLLDRGANGSAVALVMASEFGHEAVVRLLLDRGANASAGALEMASKYGHKKVLQLLEEARKSPEDYLSSIAMLFECEGP